ncbi:MAG TPA: MoaD/ThiS family protein [Paenalcaligenes hominis]|uniref:Molybdopterin synthase sulfur carrier subunit n=1 Tax=Paenalcaligenes hominis TaxID=643674 RepID=A0A1U9K1P6_9BURK|nr:MoaD/ThiS family protein [Paenalcaligenes hominis]AQS51948.1 molybdopterin synthase sulfur carrier subunit [Paenalcaligenes hominis]NJB64795.1 molybdopterin synthase sulfur carrier subunit [Paenalcaligenes hominis]GGE58921.1 molybdopterin synthase sulfur carrier subunit [Paenalcaligenes hominis]HJH25048.1 MoaD/ThiS family protein [Paenalcaligenes hominis]
MSTSTIHVLYFAQVAELTQTRQESWPLDQPIAVSAWLEHIVSTYPVLAPLQSRLKIAVNQYHVDHDAIIHPGDEVAVFEPVTGG